MSGEQLDLDAIEQRANQASPGPWHSEHPTGLGCVHIGDYGWIAGAATDGDYRYPHYDEDTETGRADAEFVAHAREDVPALVAEVRRLRDRLRLLDPHMPLSQDDVCPHGTTYDLFCGECMSEAMSPR